MCHQSVFESREEFVEISSSGKMHTFTIEKDIVYPGCRNVRSEDIECIVKSNDVFRLRRMSADRLALVNLMMGGCCTLGEKYREKIEGSHNSFGDNKDYFEANNVTCPVCGGIPYKFEDMKFYHKDGRDTRYSCYVGDVFSAYLHGSTIRDKRVTHYKVNNGFLDVVDNGEVDIQKYETLKNLKEKRQREYEEEIEKLESDLHKKKQKIEELQSVIDNKKFGEFTQRKRFESTDAASPVEEMQEAVRELGDFPAYVYVLELSIDEETWYYVGKSIQPVSRIETHMQDKNIKSVYSLEGYGTEERALVRERELAYEMAIKEDTTNIKGGR